MKKRFFVFLFLLIILQTKQLQAQVTIGSGEAPTYGALLDLKTQQAGNVTNVGDNANITSTNGGLLLPRVKLTTITSLDPVVMGGDALPVGDKLKLAGLMVYNINAIAGSLYLGIYVWNGSAWAYLVDSKVSSSMSLIAQPQAFSFYEKGTETPDALVFAVNPPKAADGTIGTVSYQWYQIVGNNVHARVGQPIVGQTDASYVPEAAFNTTNGSRSTLYAQNNGLSRFYCVATGSDGSTLTSDIVEVAVGCGAKNNLGEWLSFMCFNLGANNNSTIVSQKSFPLSAFANEVNGVHPYQPGEEELYGSLFQWGRIPDGHELRMGENASGSPAPYPNTLRHSGIAATDIGSGLRCSSISGSPTGESYPNTQVLESTAWYGKFIYASPAPEYNWNPITVQSTLDLLWRTTRYVPNDPCAQYKDDGTYKDLWHTVANGGTDGVANTGACTDPNTGWRTPSQTEWGEIYRGSTLSGAPGIATANTWTWYQTGSNRGYEIKPDGQTTTLFLPACGYRSQGTGLLYGQGSTGAYWSTSIIGANVHYLSISRSSVNLAGSSVRGGGFALRCIKN